MDCQCFKTVIQMCLDNDPDEEIHGFILSGIGFSLDWTGSRRGGGGEFSDATVCPSPSPLFVPAVSTHSVSVWVSPDFNHWLAVYSSRPNHVRDASTGENKLDFVWDLTGTKISCNNFAHLFKLLVGQCQF